MIKHPIDPVYDKNSKILILGSFPSVKSREEGFFYGHPQNRFWKVMAAVCETDVPSTIEEKKAFLVKRQIALWDVIWSCEIQGSSDSSIKNVVPNDLNRILECADIKQIYVNGKKAEQLYKKYIFPKIHRSAICLPSTSPANAAWNLEKLIKEWKSQLTLESDNKKQDSFYKSLDFMKLGQAIHKGQWQSAAMIERRMEKNAQDAGILDLKQQFTGLRQCINRKNANEAKQVLAILVSKRVKYLNRL